MLVSESSRIVLYLIDEHSVFYWKYFRGIFSASNESVHPSGLVACCSL